MKTLRTAGAVLVSALLATACAELPQKLDQVADNLRSMGQGGIGGAVAGGPTKFSQSGLAGVFKGTDGAQWPRVALTIEDMPADADLLWLTWPMPYRTGTPSASAIAAPANYCITVSAVVWKSEKSSQHFDHIPYCGKDAKLGAITDDYSFSLLGWAQFAKNSVKNTGNSRTFGPNPPLKSFPSRSIIIDKTSSRAGFMFANLVMSLGMDLTADYMHESRLWVVSTVR